MGVSACTTGGEYRVVEQGSVRAWVVGSADEGAEASAAGTARWLADHRCWVLDLNRSDRSGDSQLPWSAIVWPERTTIERADPPSLIIGPIKVADGDHFVGTGGWTDTPPAGLAIPAACRPAGVLVINKLDGQ